MNVETIIKEKQGTVIDVRTPEEFNGGHVAGSINIPLNELTSKVNEIKELTAPIILCCASGGRSGQAHGYLANQGIECYNAGSWFTIKQIQS